MATSISPAKTWRARTRRPAAFTLIELIVTIAILAILAGIVGVRFRGYFQNAAQTRLLEQLKEADRQARVYARQVDATKTILSVEKDQLQVRGQEFTSRTPFSRSFSVPRGMSLSLLPSADHGESIEFFRKGYSPTYVIEVRSASSEAPVFWFVALGSSGQCLKITDQSELDNIRSLSFGRRTNG